MREKSYTPGSGAEPVYLRSCKALVYEAEAYLKSAQERHPQRSVIYYGPRGAGKVALLRAIEKTADNMGILHTRIEVGKGGEFTPQLMLAFHRFFHDISAKAPGEGLAKKSAAWIQSFMRTGEIERESIGRGTEQDSALSSGILADDLTELFVALGKAAFQSGDTIAIFIDGVQALTKGGWNGVTAAIHRCNQLGLPVMLFCAAPPRILKIVGEACSYAERLFRFEPVGPPKEAAQEPQR